MGWILVSGKRNGEGRGQNSWAALCVQDRDFELRPQGS